MKTLFALVDCNNFFVSCERIFRPDLEGKPVVVLSSNDGCAVARSNEAKALGIPMGAPAFKYRQLFKDNNVVTFSANFSLYGNISRRITDILSTVTPRIEVYSVDESFLDLSQLPINDYKAWGSEVRQNILDWVGVPVSIGIAPTKTLAKLASELAKKDPQYEGVCLLEKKFTKELANTQIQDIWGIGRRFTPKLRAEGILTALDLARLKLGLAKQLMGVRGTQVVSELNELSCFPLEVINKPCQSIMRTRTFGEDTNDYNAIEAAIATFTAIATLSLRNSHQLAKRANLFLTNNRHKPGYRYWSKDIRLKKPSADTGEILEQIVETLQYMYYAPIQYHRAGIGLYDLIPEKELQIDLLGEISSTAHDKSLSRLRAIDAINNKFGKEHIVYAAEKLGSVWQPKYRLRSPRYVTHWDELPKLKII